MRHLCVQGHLRGGEDWLANPALPDDVVRETVPGERRHACHAMPCSTGQSGAIHHFAPTHGALQSPCSAGCAGWALTSCGCYEARHCHAFNNNSSNSKVFLPPRLAWWAWSRAGNIRRAEHFVGFLSRFLSHLSIKMDSPIVTSVSPTQFLTELQRDLLVDAKTLK